MRYFVTMALVLTATVAAGQTAAGPATKAAATRPAFTVGKETTKIAGPLMANGRPDYVRAIDEACGKGVTAETNALAGLLEVFGTGNSVLPEKGKSEVLKRLGIGEVKAASFEGINDFFKRVGLSDAEIYAKIDDLVPTRGKPWAAKDYPQIADWLAANDAALDRIVKVSERKHYYWPFVATGEQFPMVSVLLPSLGRGREAANALGARAMLRLGKGQVKEAQRDVLAIHRLGRLSTQGATVIERLVGVAIESIAAKCDEAMAEHWGGDDAKAYLAQLAKLTPMQPMWGAVDVGERYSMLDTTMTIAETGQEGIQSIVKVVSGEEPKNLAGAKALTDVDWDAVLKRLNAEFDRQVEGMRLPTFAQRKAAGEAFDKETGKVAAKVGVDDPATFIATLKTLEPAKRTERMGDFIMKILMPSLGRAGELADRAQQETDLGTVAVALAAYHGDKGSYPEKLEELAPAYLKEIPKDLFADAPLIYRKQGAGFVMYSVGPNMADDNGLAAKTLREGDMVVRVRK